MKTVNDLPLMVPETSGLKSVDIINSGVITADAAYEAQASIVRNSIPSGFVTLGELDYDYMSNNENKVKLKTESVAYVNGYEIRIPKGTVIDLGRAPEKEPREDLVFLEVWKSKSRKENHVSAVTGTHYELTDNSVKVEWRIRHVANVEPTGVPDLGIFEGWRETSHSMATGQGRLPQPLAEDKTKPRNYFYFGKFRQEWSHPSSDIIDNGLGVCSETDSYAIPMFRLYRKPSCGKSIPFEYSKINPKVDYTKFAKLVKEEKVERVVTENIKGRSLVNLVKCSSKDIQLDDLGSFWGKYLDYVGGGLKPDTTYTLIIDFKLQNSVHIKLDSIMLGTSASLSGYGNNFRVWDIPIGTNRIKFTTPSDYDKRVFGFVIEKISSSTQPTLRVNKCMIVEGDLTNDTLLEHFEGLKSLGEDDGNLVTIKNGILDDNTYDITDGIQKLPTFSRVTHVLSENSITPEVVASGDGVSETSLLELGTKLATSGDEVVEFSEIRGRTVQNLIKNYYDFSVLKGGSCNNGVIELRQQSVDSTFGYLKDNLLLRPDTTYTLVVDVIHNTVKASEGSLALSIGRTGLGHGNWALNLHSLINVPLNTTGTFRAKATLDSSAVGANGTIIGTGGFLPKHPTSPSGSVKFRLLLLEGDHTTTPVDKLSFIEGIKSVGESEGNVVDLKTHSKNLISKDMYTNTWFMGDSIHIDRNDTSGKKYSIYGIRTYSATKLVLSSNKEFNRLVYRGKDSNNRVIYSGSLGSVSITSYVFQNIPKDVVTLDMYLNSVGIDESYNFMLEESEVVNSYEPYKEYTQNVHLREPLRRIANAYDKLAGNTLTRKVKKVVLTGSEDWIISDDRKAKTIRFSTAPPVPFTLSMAMSDKFTFYSNTGIDEECFTVATDERIHIRVLRSKLTPVSTEGFQAWLSKNPVTVYYELATPIEEYLENIYDKESIKTYQLDAPLRGLPDGVKDEIKDGVLIRRCGELILNGEEDWREPTSDDKKPPADTGFIRLYSSILSAKPSSYCLCDKFSYGKGAIDPKEKIYITTTPNVSITIPKSKVANAEALKTWLKSNPTKIIYELATPLEIPLSEDTSQAANFSLHRQLVDEEWLRELPNGVKDTIENGKVKRRIARRVLTGTNEWWGYTAEPNLGRIIATLDESTVIPKYVLSSDFEYVPWEECPWLRSTPTISMPSGYNHLYVYHPAITSREAWIEYVNQHPMTVLYELKTAKDETLTSKNCLPYPHHGFNTYCGSMYVGDGMNYILSDNKMPSEDPIVVETDFRELESNTKVEDCRYKKCDDGYDGSYTTSKSMNLLDTSIENGELSYPDVKYTPVKDGFKVSNTSAGAYANVFFKVFLKANVPYRIGYTKSDSVSGFVDLKTLSSVWITNLDSGTVFTITETGFYYIIFYCTAAHAAVGSATFTEVRLTEGRDLVEYVPYSKTTEYLEVVKENDIEDLRHQVSLTGFNYDKVLNESFDKLLRGEL